MARLALLLISITGLPHLSPVRADDAEAKAVKFVEKFGGIVLRDEKKPGKPGLEVGLNSSDLTDDGVKELAGFRNLSTLGIEATAVTDAGLKQLGTLTTLAELDTQTVAVELSDSGEVFHGTHP